MILAPVGDEQIGEAVVVVVRRADALAPARALPSPIFVVTSREPALAVVVIQAARAALARDEEDIRQPVVIVIEKRRAAAGGLEDELLRRVAAVRKAIGQPGARGHVAEVRPVRRGREEQQQRAHLTVWACLAEPLQKLGELALGRLAQLVENRLLPLRVVQRARCCDTPSSGA